MIRGMERRRLLELLLNTLEGERHLRAALLLELLDELETTEQLAPAAGLARRMLAALETGHVGDEEFTVDLATLRRLVQAHATAA
jgi:hypothetical protein